MDEREQLLALAKNCTPLLTGLVQTENEYIYLCSKTNKFKNDSGGLFSACWYAPGWRSARVLTSPQIRSFNAPCPI